MPQRMQIQQIYKLILSQLFYILGLCMINARDKRFVKHVKNMTDYFILLALQFI